MDTLTIKNWKFVAGSIPLEFVNTVSGRAHENDKNPIDYKIIGDKLGNFYDLVNWGHALGILDNNLTQELNTFASQNGESAAKIFKRASALRETIYRIIISIIKGYKPTAEDIEILSQECISAREHQKLFFDSDIFKWDFDLINGGHEFIIWCIAITASELLTSNQLHRVKECVGENCGWLFLDTSKNRSRHWCDMKDCGNIAKVHRFRKKQK
jgi:predicted RNA-binding Zn ribbon-like protein